MTFQALWGTHEAQSSARETLTVCHLLAWRRELQEQRLAACSAPRFQVGHGRPDLPQPGTWEPQPGSIYRWEVKAQGGGAEVTQLVSGRVRPAPGLS